MRNVKAARNPFESLQRGEIFARACLDFSKVRKICRPRVCASQLSPTWKREEKKFFFPRFNSRVKKKCDRREQRCSGCVTHTGSKIPSALPPQPLILSDGNQATDSDVIIIHVVNHLLLWEKKKQTLSSSLPHPTPLHFQI